MTTDNTNTKTESDISLFERLESEVRSYARNFPVVFDRASGAHLFTDDGRDYLDFLTGCSSLNYGHNPEPMKQALLDYVAADGLSHGLDMYSTAKAGFLRAFNEIILQPRELDYVVQFPGPTGANAVEAALKLARKVTGRHNVIAFTNAFHGVTAGALACTGNSHHRGGAGMPLQGVTRMPYAGYMGDAVDSAEYLDQVLSDPSSGVDAPAAVILETVQGEGGFNTASDNWLRRIAAITRKHGALLIVDDIQAGAGRTGRFFSFEDSGIKPDMVTLAKSVSGYGLPLALVLIDPRHDIWAPGEHNGTFRGNCMAFVTARTALEHFWRDAGFEQSLQDKSRLLRERLQRMADAAGLPGDAIKGRGMMLGLRMPSGERAAEVVAAAFANGLIIETGGSQDEVLKCLPPLNISTAELETGLDILGQAVSSVTKKASRKAA